MKKGFFYFTLALIALGLFVSTPKVLLFYDASEYISIISSNTFSESFSMGHYPKHPIFISFLWIITHLLKSIFNISFEYAGNLFSFLCGIISIIYFTKICKFILTDKKTFLATIIFTFFSSIWILYSNLMVESLLLMLFLLTLYSLLKYLDKPSVRILILYIFLIILLLGTHIQAIFWLPVIFIYPFIFSMDFKDTNYKKVLLITFIVVTLFFIWYLIFFPSGEGLLGIDETLSMAIPKDLGFISLLRMLRNIVVSVFRGFSVLVPILMILILYKRRKDRKFLLAFLVFAICLFITGSFWSGDFMIRRIVFAGVVFAPLLVYSYPALSLGIFVYLTPILLSNALLYSQNSDSMPLIMMKSMHKNMPSGNVLIQTHYVRPLTDYDGDVIWLGQEKPSEIDLILSEGKEVYLDSQALTSPYLLYVGNNLHITSIGKFGESEASHLFSKYIFPLNIVENAEKRVFVYQLLENNQDIKIDKGPIGSQDKNRDERFEIITGKADPGEAVYIYSRKLERRIHRERIDYGDIITWLWVFISKRHEPTGWTYADSQGVYMYPINTSDIDDIEVVINEKR